MHSPFHKLLHGSLGSIPLLPRYFISAGFSPPAANFYFARRQPHLGCVRLAPAIAHSSLILQSIAKVHLHSSAPFVSASWRKNTSVAFYVAAIAPADRGFPGSPFVGARRPPPFRRTSLFRRPSSGSQSLQCGQVCHTAMLLFCRRRFYRKEKKYNIGEAFKACFHLSFSLPENEYIFGSRLPIGSDASLKMEYYVT